MTIPEWLKAPIPGIPDARWDWLRQDLARHLGDDVKTRSYVYPAGEGCVQVEWSIGRHRADLEVRLDDRKALFGWSDLDSEADGELELELKRTEDWHRLARQLREWAEPPEPRPET